MAKAYKDGAQLKKVYYNGAQVKKWYHNNALVYSAAVTVTNNLAAASSARITWQDTGYANHTQAGAAVPLVPGHRYYVRAQASTWAYSGGNGFSATGSAQFCGTVIAASAGTGALAPAVVTGHAILTASAASANVTAGIVRNNSTQGATTATFYMVVDLTEIEAARGAQYTADSFWAACGGAVFYGSKELEV